MKLAADAIGILARERPGLQIQTKPFHSTLVAKDEKRGLSASALAAGHDCHSRSSPFHALGSDVASIVVIWAAGQQIRKRAAKGLPHHALGR